MMGNVENKKYEKLYDKNRIYNHLIIKMKVTSLHQNLFSCISCINCNFSYSVHMPNTPHTIFPDFRSH